MADLKISALNALAGADLVAADVVAVVDDSASETKKLTVSDLIANGTTLISDATIPSAKILFSAGSVATASVADAGITTAKVADSSITAAKLANNSSVTLVSTLPGSGDFTGQIALDTDDDKIYIWDGSAWDSVKGAGSINVVNGSTTGEINIVTSTSGDTVTVSATLDNTTAAAQFLAGPTGAGGTVGYRAIIGTDLPTASTTAKGGVIVNGNGLTMSSDTIAINNTVTAETSENHIVQYDANGLITGGRAIIAADVPVATSTAVGVIKPGSGLGVTGAGELNHDNSVTAGTASKVTFDTEGHITGSESLVASDIPNLDAAKVTTGTFATARIASDAVTAEKLADRSTATIAETTPTGGAFIGQTHLNSITGDYFLWDGNVWQPIGISVGEIVLAGTYNASTNKMATVTSEGTALSFVVGSALPTASDSNKGYYVVVSTAGTGTSPAPTVALNPPDFLLSTGTVYTEIDVSATVTAQQASNVAFTAAGNISATNVQAALEELDTEKVGAASPTFTGTVALGEDAVMTFEGATSNDFETTLTVTDPTADRTITLPNVTGTVLTTGDTGSVTSAMIADGAIVNADINASAEIAVSKLANGTARQLLQTDVAGSGVEFTSNVDVPGTLDVTGAATLDSTLGVTGLISADGKVKFPAGSASAPSFYSGTDTNTGLYFSAADEVSVATGGTQRVVVDSSGRLLVGPSSTSTAGSVVIQGNSVGSSSYGLVRLAKGSTTPADGDTLGLVAFGDSSHSTAAQISCQRDGGTWTSGSSQPTRILFNTAPNGSSGSSERLRIDSSGNVGIGTSSPSAKLHVNGTTTHGGDVTFSGDNYNVLWDKSEDRLEFGDNAKATFGASADLQIYHDGSHSFIKDDGTGEIKIAGTVRIVNNANTETIAKFTPDGSVELHYDNSKKFETTTSGVDVTGKVECDSLAVNNASPDSIFHVKATDGDSVPARITSTGALTTIGFETNSSANSYNVRVGAAGANDFVAYTNNTERMRITSVGYIGVNKSSPDRAIDVEYTNNTVYNAANQSPELGAVRIYNMSTTAGCTAGEILFGARASGSGYASITAISPGSQECELAFRVQDSATFNEALRINKSGVVIAKNGAAAEIGTLNSASTVTPNFATSCNFTLTLGTNVTLANPSDLTAGQSGSIFLVQDGTGSRTITFGSYWDFAGGTAPTLSTAANSVDRLDYIVRTTGSIHAVVTLAYS